MDQCTIRISGRNMTSKLFIFNKIDGLSKDTATLRTGLAGYSFKMRLPTPVIAQLQVKHESGNAV